MDRHTPTRPHAALGCWLGVAAFGGKASCGILRPSCGRAHATRGQPESRKTADRFEAFETLDAAEAREKKLKGYRRSKKEDLVRSVNPTWTEVVPS